MSNLDGLVTSRLNEEISNLKIGMLDLGTGILQHKASKQHKASDKLLDSEMKLVFELLDEPFSCIEENSPDQQEAITFLTELYNDPEAQVVRLNLDTAPLQPISKRYIDARGRFWNRRLQGSCRGNIALRKGKFYIPGGSIYDAQVVVDARLLIERRPLADRKMFEQLYGLSPEQVEALASQECFNTLRIINAISGLRLSDR